MTTHPGIADWKRVEPRGMAAGRLLLRVLAALRHHSLDRAIARGVDPSSSPLLAFRAGRLTRARSRERLANSVRGVIAAAEHPPRMPSAKVPPSQSEVLGAQFALDEVEGLLCSSLPVYAEGIARLEMLLTDGASPLYSPEHPGELEEELERIVAGLQGREEDW